MTDNYFWENNANTENKVEVDTKIETVSEIERKLREIDLKRREDRLNRREEIERKKNTKAMVCCVTGCGICCGGIGGCCFFSIMLPVIIIRSAGELVMLPSSISCSIHRRYKYNKLIKEWYLLQSEQIKKACDDHFDGAISYKSMNAKVKITIKEVISKFNINNNNDTTILNQDLERNLKLIPHCILQRNRYIWNTMPDKDEFFKLMNRMANGLGLIRGHSTGQLIDEHRLKELLIECTKLCSICQDDDEKLTTENSTMTSCAHIFHTDCLNSWYQRKKECPSCRKEQE